MTIIQFFSTCVETDAAWSTSLCVLTFSQIHLRIPAKAIILPLDSFHLPR